MGQIQIGNIDLSWVTSEPDSLPGLNTNPTGVPSNVGGQAAYSNVMSNGPTNSVTLAPNARVPEGYQKDPITGEVTKSDLPANPDQKPRK